MANETHHEPVFPSRFGRRTFLSLSAGAAASVTIPGARTALAGVADCHPTITPPEYLGLVPSPSDVLGFAVGRDREVTVEESDAYLDAVAASSDRVVVDTLGTSHEGRPIRYAVIGRSDHVTPEGLEAVRQAHLAIQDPTTPASQVDAIAETTPAFLWVGGSIHGNEESGTDAGLWLLHGLADRDDCVVNRILRGAVVILIPVQNPDGRARDTRRNVYAFDLNRDHYARTQPETDAKLELMRRYPPLMLLDHHEFGYYRSFFPPNDDPINHEITERTVSDINKVYGSAMADEFDRQGWSYFNRGYGYDLFAPIFTDTVTALGFQGSGMTIEIYNGGEIRKREIRQRAVMWVVLAAAAARRERLLRDRHVASVEAVEQGRRGTLLPNRVYEADNTVRVEVPTAPLRHYFIRTDDAESRPEAQRLARTLQRMDVEVYRLTAPLRVPDYRPHREDARAVTLPAGTFWVPMAQRQKHWIQAAMNEDAYVPITRAYGLTGFSLALLSGAETGWSGAVLDPAATLAREQSPPDAPTPPGSVPTIKVFQTSGGVYAWEGTRWVQFLLDHVWGLPYERIRADDVRGGALESAEVLLVPAGGVNSALENLRKPGQRALVEWVNAGGRYVGWRWGSAQLPWALGLSQARYGYPSTEIRDILVRAHLVAGSPLAAGARSRVWFVHDGDMVMRTEPRGSVAARFPEWKSGSFEVNGFPGGTRVLPGKAVVADELVGSGRVITSSLDFNYRAETVGARTLLWNAIVGPDPAGARTAAAVFDAEAVARRAATLEDDAVPTAVRVSVARSEASAARVVLAGFGGNVRRLPTRGLDVVTLIVDNPDGLSVEEHPYALEIPGALQAAGVTVLGFHMPA